MPEQVSYVLEEFVERAHQMEREFLKLSPDSGVIFAGVTAIPSEDGVPSGYKITVGISRKFEVGTGIAIAKKVLGDYLDPKKPLNITVFRGSSGPCRDRLE